MLTQRRVLLLLSAYDPQTHRAAVAAAQRYHWHLDANLLVAQRMIRNWSGEGILCSLGNEKALGDYVLSRGVPAVDLSTGRTDLKLPRVSADNRAIGRLAAEHLLHYQHTNFAWFSSTRTPYGDLRLAGYRSALSERGYQVQRMDGKGCQSSELMLQRLQQLERPCAILAMDDGDAGWLSNLCQNAGYHVPMDFAILGTDNNPLVCEVQSVPLSSIDKNANQIVAQGAKRLDSLMKNADDPSDAIEYVQPVGVVTRASTDGFAVADELVREALSFLQMHLSEKVGTPEVAAMLGVSKTLLNQSFSKTMQTSLHQVLMRMRLREAATLLTATDWNLSRIAEATGFSHAAHLSNSFRKHYGCGTRAYRERS